MHGELIELMQVFITGEDQSKTHVDRIGGVLIDSYIGSELYDELMVAVASYEPGGGQHMWSEEDLERDFEYAIRRLTTEKDYYLP